MFVCSDFQKQFIMQGIDTTNNFGYKQIHMFTPSVNNKPPQKIINNLIYFLSDNIYMNINSEKEENLNVSKQNSCVVSRRMSNSNIGGEKNYAYKLGSSAQRNRSSQISQAADNPIDAVQNEQSNLQNYSQNLFISQYYLEEGQINDSINANYKKNDSTAAQSRNSSIPHVSQRESHRRSLSSLITSSTLKQVTRRAIIRQQQLQFDNPDNSNNNDDDADNPNKDDPYSNTYKIGRKLHTSQNKNDRNIQANSSISESVVIQNSDQKAIHSSLLQNDMIRHKVVNANFKDSKEVNKYLKEREEGDVDVKRQRVKDQKERKEEIRELNTQLQQIRVQEKAHMIRIGQEKNSQIRNNNMLIQQQNAIAQAEHIRNHSSFPMNQEQNNIQNQLIQNTNFLTKQISSFQTKKNQQEYLQSNQLKAQTIKNQKLFPFIPKHYHHNSNFNQSKISGGLNQSAIEIDSLYQSEMNKKQHSVDYQSKEQLNVKRSLSICEKTLNNNSQIIVSIVKNNDNLNHSALYSQDDSSRLPNNKKLPSLEKTKQALSNYLQNSNGYNPSGSILPSLNQGSEMSPSKVKNESIQNNTNGKSYKGSQAKKRNNSSHQKERIIHSVFPEEFYPIANGQSENQFLFDFNAEINKSHKINKLSHIQHNRK